MTRSPTCEKEAEGAFISCMRICERPGVCTPEHTSLCAKLPSIKRQVVLCEFAVVLLSHLFWSIQIEEVLDSNDQCKIPLPSVSYLHDHGCLPWLQRQRQPPEPGGRVKICAGIGIEKRSCDMLAVEKPWRGDRAAIGANGKVSPPVVAILSRVSLAPKGRWCQLEPGCRQ